MPREDAQLTKITAKGDREVELVRSFSAPVESVWRCYTEPALVGRWLLGPPGWRMSVCEIDLTVGGDYQYRWRNVDSGEEFGVAGSFVEIVHERRITHTERPEGAPEMSGSHISIDLAPQGDSTRLVMTITYANADARKTALATGMTEGMGISFDKLARVLSD